jgi:hypothetical protein
MPEIGCLNISNEVESSRRTSRRSNQRDTPPRVIGDRLAQAVDRFWQLDAARQSAPGAVPVDHMMVMADTFARMSLPESEEQESEDADSTAGENGSEPDELELRLRLALMDGIESMGKNLPKKD